MEDLKLAALVQGLRQLDQRVGDGDVEASAERIWESLSKERSIGSDVGAVREPPFRSKRKMVSWQRYLSIAAVMLIAVVTYISWGNSRTAPTTTSPAKSYSTRSGQRVSLTLSDGSRVTLAPATTLSVSDRNINLSGEAMFVVSHSSGVPFLVHAGGTTVRVLGTTFSVRQYASESKAKIAVAEGRVSVGDAILNSGDLAIAAGNNAEVVHDAERALGWLAFSQGTLSLETQTLGEAAPELSRWLDLDVQIRSDVSGRRLKARLKNISPEVVLNEIAELTETSYVRKGHTVLFAKSEK